MKLTSTIFPVSIYRYLLTAMLSVFMFIFIVTMNPTGSFIRMSSWAHVMAVVNVILSVFECTMIYLGISRICFVDNKSRYMVYLAVIWHAFAALYYFLYWTYFL